MKRSDARLLACDYVVETRPFRDVRAFVIAHHYSGGAANTAVHAFGLRRADSLEIVGGALWMPPTRVCAESVSREHWRTVLSLSRLAVHPDVPPNGASFLIGRCIRALRAEGRWSHLVTFADESQGHTGAIYRATNWTYVGRTKPEPRWVDTDGRQVSRLATKSRTASDMLALAYRIEGKYAKHKFVMPLVRPAMAEAAE